jgi:hypothetical protein
MSIRYCGFLFSCLVSFPSFAAGANTVVEQAAQACSGFSSIEARTHGGTMQLQNYNLSVQGSDLLIFKETGVLLRRIEKFSYADYSKCILDLVKIVVSLNAPSQKIPADIFDKVRIGEFGRTNLSYIEGVLGPAISKDEKLDEYKYLATFLSDGFKVEVSYLHRESNLIVGIKVSIDTANSSTFGHVVLHGYWNDGRIKPGVILGKTKLKDLIADVDCYIGYEGGVINNTDPKYSCIDPGPHSRLWVALKIHMNDFHDDDPDIYHLFRLRDQYIDGRDAVLPLEPEEINGLERKYQIKSNGIESVILSKLMTHTVTGFQIFNYLSDGVIE